MTQILTLAANVADKALTTDVPAWQVVVLGMGTVFVVLIAIIAICQIMGAIMKSVQKKKPADAPKAAPTASANAEIANRGEFVAAVSAAIAEDLGTDISAIRIHSIKKL